MFFITRKRFEEVVAERMKEYEERRFREREMENLHNAIWRLEDRVCLLEGKGKTYEAPVEVKNAERF